MRGNLIGWRSTLHTLYRDYAEDIVNRVLAKTCLTIPDGEVLRLSGSRVPQHPNTIQHEIRQLYNVSDRLDLLAEQHTLISERIHQHLGKHS